MANASYNQTETLEKLERLTQLETVVAEQRIRMEKYRTMYETLKAEHSQAEDALARKDNDITGLKTEMSALEGRYHQALEQAKAERDAKTQECEELRVQIMTPQRMEVIKMKLQEEIEGPYKQKLDALELENDQYRSTFNKVRYDYSFLKSEYEHEQTQHKAVMQELQTQHQYEIDSLMKEKETLLQRVKSNEASIDAQKMRNLQRDNSQLNLKIRSLLAELDEIREQREASGLQSDHVSRLQARQVSELSARCKTLEAENEAHKVQSSKVQGEHERMLREQEDLSGKLYKVERENISLTNQINELKHAHKVELSNIRIELTKDRGEVERERDTLKQEFGTCESRVKILEQNIEQLKKALEEKEQDVVRRIQGAQESEWGKISSLESIKLQLESQLEESEKESQSRESQSKKQMEHLQEQSQQLQGEKSKLEKDIVQLKSQLNQQNSLKRDLDEEQFRNQDLKRKSQGLQNEIEKLLTREQEYKNDVEKLKDTVHLLRNELTASRLQSDANLEDMTKDVQEQKTKLENEQKEMSKKLDDLQKQIKASKKKEDKLKLLAKRRDGKRKQEIQELTEQISLLKAKEEKLETEKNAIQKNMNLEHERTKRRLDKLKKCHVQFNRVLNVSNAGVPDLSFLNSTPFLGNTMLERVPTGTALRHDDLDHELLSVPVLDDDK